MKKIKNSQSQKEFTGSYKKKECNRKSNEKYFSSKIMHKMWWRD